LGIILTQVVQILVDLLIWPDALRVLDTPRRVRFFLDKLDDDEGPTLVGRPEVRRYWLPLVELERRVF